MANVKVKVNRAALVQLLDQPGVAQKVSDAAERVATSVRSYAGEVHGYPVKVWTDSGRNRQRPSRPRSAVIVTHPTPKGRKHAQDVLRAATQTLFGGNAEVYRK